MENQVNISKNYGDINTTNQTHGGSGDNVVNKNVLHYHFPKQTLKSKAEIINGFKTASFILSEYQNHFSNLKNAHIERSETKKLLNWIKIPLSKNSSSIKLLVGKAGIGKSVIMRDLYDLLLEENIPVLGIKSDKYLRENISDLEQKLNFKTSIVEQVKMLNNAAKPVVVLIDQLDALSQTLVLKRDYLIVYRTLIEDLKNSNVNLRIVISVREVDLQIDPLLSPYKKGNNVIKVGLLEKSEVKKVLNSLNVTLKKVNNSLFELLKIPNHLNIFCEIYRTDLPLQNIKTVKNLYDELWEKYIENIDQKAKVTTSKCTELLFNMASDMYEATPNLTESRNWKKYRKELDYLSSVGFLIEKSTTIQFLHQSLYDYVFVRYFIDSNQDILEYLNENHQGLFVRAGLKMIVQSLRADRKHNKYFEIYNEILLSGNYRFHLQHLLINLLGFIDLPTKKEKQFVKSKILNSTDFRMLFIDAIHTKNWLVFLIKQKAFNDLILNPTNDQDTDKWIWTLSRFFPQERETILEYVTNLPDFKNKIKILTHLLYRLRVWDNPIAFKLYETYFDKKLIYPRANFVILESMFDNIENINYVTGTYYKQLNLDEISNSDSRFSFL